MNAPHLRFYLLLSNYTEEKTKAVASGPAQAAFIDPNSLTSLVQKPDLINAVEGMLREIRAKLLAPLEVLTSPSQARLDVAVLADLIVRCLLAKPWPEALWVSSSRLKALFHQAGHGKFSVQKVDHIKRLWALWVEEQYPGKDFANEVGLALEKPQEEKKENPQDLTVDLGGAREHRLDPSREQSGPPPKVQTRGRCHCDQADDLGDSSLGGSDGHQARDGGSGGGLR